MKRNAWRLLALTGALASSTSAAQASGAQALAPATDAAARDGGAAARLEPRVPAQRMGWQSAGWLIRPEREAQEQPESMLDALHLKQGETVADVGAGAGYHAWRIAKRVGPKGTVYATDIQPEMLELLREAMRQRGIRNVVAVQASEENTGLPEGQLDVALLVDVFHEVTEPQAFLRQLRRALKPTGRLVLVEFRAEDPEVPIRAEHKMTAEQVIGELALGGFRLTERHEFLPWQHLLVFVPAR